MAASVVQEGAGLGVASQLGSMCVSSRRGVALPAPSVVVVANGKRTSRMVGVRAAVSGG